MAGYRKFWLVNSLGQKYYLTDEKESKTFLSNPSGFGFKANYKTRKINNSELLISEGLDNVDVNGELVFYGGSPNVIYEDYQKFISFIRFKPLEFHYLTPNFVDDERYSFYSNVVISSISKGEMSKDGILSATINIHRLSQWLDSTEHTYVISNNNTIDTKAPVYDPTKTYTVGERVRYTDTYTDKFGKTTDHVTQTYECKTAITSPEAFTRSHWKKVQVGKNYPFMRPFYYQGNDFSSGLEIANTGTDEAGFTLTIDGKISNPIFSLYQNNVRYGLCALKGTYGHVLVNSVDGEAYIYLEDENGMVISNPEQKQNFEVRDGISYFTWCKLKVGTSTFILTAGNLDQFGGTVELAFKNSYFSV